MTASPASSVMCYDPYFIQTEFSKMQSEQVLGRVINALNLNDTLGKKYNNGAPLKTDDTMTWLKQHMSLSPERNTKLIDIKVSSEDPNEAARLANVIAQAYQDYRLERWKTNTMVGIRALEMEFTEDQARIQDVQTNVDQLRRDLHIVDLDPNSLTPSPTISSTDMQRYNEEKIESEKSYTELLTMLDHLRALQATNPIVLRDVLPRMNEDTALSGLLDKWRQSLQTYVALTNDYGMSSPEVTRSQSMIQELDQEINASVTGVMASLESKVTALKARLDTLTNTLSTAINTDLAEGERGRPYWDANRKQANMIDLRTLLEACI